MAIHTDPRPVSPHLHSGEVGTSEAANDAAFAWLATEHPSHPWELAPITYSISQTIDLGDTGNRRGQKLIGAGMGVDQTLINMSNTALPIITFGGEGQQIRDMMLTYNFNTAAPTTAVAMQATGTQCLNARIENIWAIGVGNGLDTGNVQWFSNVVENLRIADYTGRAINVLEQSTGNLWSNIYLNNADISGGGDFTTWGRRPAEHAVFCRGGDENTWRQLNVEYGNFTQRPIMFQNPGIVDVLSLHVEGCEWGDFWALFSVFGEQAMATVTSAMIDYNYPNGNVGTTQAVFETGPNSQLDVRSCVVRDNGASRMYLVRQVMQPANTPTPAVIFLRNILDRGTDALRLGLGPYGPADLLDIAAGSFAAVSPGSIKEYNDQYFTLEDQQVADAYYRVTIENGVLTATAV